MKIEFERPDYCKGCKQADLSLNTATMYGERNGRSEPCEIIHDIVCTHDAACKRMHEMENITDKKT